jgi:hypothetical protein
MKSMPYNAKKIKQKLLLRVKVTLPSLSKV